MFKVRSGAKSVILQGVLVSHEQRHLVIVNSFILQKQKLEHVNYTHCSRNKLNVQDSISVSQLEVDGDPGFENFSSIGNFVSLSRVKKTSAKYNALCLT